MACPFASVVVDAGFTDAEPVVTANVTFTPETAVPFAVTRTMSGLESVAPTICD